MQFNGTSELDKTLISSSVFGLETTWDMRQNTENVKSAKAVLVCRPNSHPFQDRTVSLEQPVKIGRSVARARPNTSNAIFDCKVLSRNHALLWYDAGKFYLQDTKSSNGTFVNNQRLSKSSEESPPREVCSGDIVQFGVDVLEVNKKVTHGCIVATLQLYLPDGKEAKASSSNITEKSLPTSISVADFYQLSQHLKEAKEREQLLENKIAEMSKIMNSAIEAIEDNWKSLIEEDRLLTKVDILERQLQATHKSMTEDKLTEEVLHLHEEKGKYQDVAKEALRKALQEKVDIQKKLIDFERKLNNIEEEKMLVQAMYDKSLEEIQELANKYEKAEDKTREMADEMDKNAEKYKEEMEILGKQASDSQQIGEDKDKIISELAGKVDPTLVKSILLAHNLNLSIISPIDNNGMGSDENGDNNNSNVTNDESPNALTECKVEVVKVGGGGGDEIMNNLENANKKETNNNLANLLDLFEDLKRVSKKAQISEYMKDVIGKLDVEIKQIKNCSNHSFKIEDADVPNENHLAIEYEREDMPKDIQKHQDWWIVKANLDFMDCRVDLIKAILKDKKGLIKKLESEVSAANSELATSNQERKRLEDAHNELSNQLDDQRCKVEMFTNLNAELNTKLNGLQERIMIMEEAGKNSDQTIQNIKNEANELIISLRERDKQIASLTDEIKGLKTSSLNSKPDQRMMSDSIHSNSHLIRAEISIQTESDKQELGPQLGAAIHEGFKDPSQPKSLTDIEEELAIFKDKFRESSESNMNLKRMVSELQKEQAIFNNQSRLITLLPVIVLMLAFLFGFYKMFFATDE